MFHHKLPEDRAGSCSRNILHLYSEGVRFESRTGSSEVSLVTSSKRNECPTSGHSRSLPDTFQFISQHHPAIDSASLQATVAPLQIISNSSASIILPSTVPRFRPRTPHSRQFPIHQSASSCDR